MQTDLLKCRSRVDLGISFRRDSDQQGEFTIVYAADGLNAEVPRSTGWRSRADRLKALDDRGSVNLDLSLTMQRVPTSKK